MPNNALRWGGAWGVPRGERPLDPEGGPVAEFAARLRKLRDEAGRPTYRELARRAHYSIATLSGAAAGHQLPTLAVTLAYVRACGGDEREWERIWRGAAARCTAGPPGADAERGADPAPAPLRRSGAFRQSDADTFFGREELTGQLVEHLREKRFLVLFGASGSGKSSVLCAGVLPRFSGTPALVLTPGPHPLEECAIQLAARAGLAPGSLHAELATDPRALHRVLRQILAGSAEPADEHLLVVDQFEEVFTLCRDPAEREAFVASLLHAAQTPDSRCRVVLAVRSDFYTHCTRLPGLVAALADAHVPVGPMTTDELRAAIVRPAARAGLTVEGAPPRHPRRRRPRPPRRAPAALARAPGDLAPPPGQRPHPRRVPGGGRLRGRPRPDRRGLPRRPERDPAPPDPAALPAPRRPGRGHRGHQAPRPAPRTGRHRGHRARPRSGHPGPAAHRRPGPCRDHPRGPDPLLAPARHLARRGPGPAAPAPRAHRGHRRLGSPLDHDPDTLYRGVRLAAVKDIPRDALTARERAFRDASESAEKAAALRVRRQVRRLRRLVGALVVLLVCVATAVGFAVRSQRIVTAQRNHALALKAVDTSAALRARDPSLATQLALAAHRLEPTETTRDGLLSVLPRTLDQHVHALAVSPDGRTLAAAR
ncbi:hypothetical protein LT493_24810 [Streptomyces tricolor]|nr:hypothetical protein [Streptomyces tricolor]